MPKRRPHIAIVINLDYAWKRHHDAFAGTQAALGERGWDSTAWPFPPPTLDIPGSDRQYDGIVARATPQLVAKAKRAGIPLVNIWMNSPARDTPTVTIDSVGVGKMAGEHLLSRGFRRFAFLGYRQNKASQGCEEGFRKATGLKRGRYARMAVLSSYSESARNWDRFSTDLNAWLPTLTPPLTSYQITRQ